MNVELKIHRDGIDYASEFNTGTGKWIERDGEYIQVLVLAVDDKPLGHPDKMYVHVLLKTFNPLELA